MCVRPGGEKILKAFKEDQMDAKGINPGVVDPERGRSAGCDGGTARNEHGDLRLSAEGSTNLLLRSEN